MKKVVSRSTLLIAATIAILAMTTAKAETPLMRMDIPFAFLAGEHTLPAGNYWVRVDTDFRFLELRPADGTGAQRVALAGGQFAVKKVSETPSPSGSAVSVTGLMGRLFCCNQA